MKISFLKAVLMVMIALYKILIKCLILVDKNSHNNSKETDKMLIKLIIKENKQIFIIIIIRIDRKLLKTM